MSTKALLISAILHFDKVSRSQVLATHQSPEGSTYLCNMDLSRCWSICPLSVSITLKALLISATLLDTAMTARINICASITRRLYLSLQRTQDGGSQATEGSTYLCNFKEKVGISVEDAHFRLNYPKALLISATNSIRRAWTFTGAIASQSPEGSTYLCNRLQRKDYSGRGS